MNDILGKFIATALALALAWLIASIGYAITTSFATKQCTVTITDMQGVRHQIKGVADNE